MSGINDNGINTSLYQGLCTVERINSDTDTSSNTQTALVVLAGHRLVLGLRDILISDQTHEMVGIVNHGEFLYFVFLKNLCSSRQICALVCSDQIL